MIGSPIAASVIGTLVVALVTALVLTSLVQRYAVSHGLMDVPNRRSSHKQVTPRGGGLAIVIVVVVWVAAGMGVGWFPRDFGVAVIGGGSVLALTNFIDDHGHVAAPIRATVQLFAASWAVYWVGPAHSVDLGLATVQLGPAAVPLAILAIVGFTNLYNFMDGIDGLAGGEAVCGGVFGGALLLATGAIQLGWFGLLVGVSAAGFLAWNWPPARIFLGDVGSGPLGYWFAVLALGSANVGGPGILVWFLLFGAFVFDGTVTLVRRILAGYEWYLPHRDHAYQRAVQAGASHRQVTTVVLAVNGILAALATAAVCQPATLLATVVVGLALLTVVYVWVERHQPPQAGGS